MAVTLSGIIIGCLQCLIRKWRRKKIFKTAKNPTKHTHLKIMKVVMNPGGHRTVLFSRAEKKRNGEKSSMLNPGAISGLLCAPGHQESNANVRRLYGKVWALEEKEGSSDSGSATYSVHDLRILFTFFEPHL